MVTLGLYLEVGQGALGARIAHWSEAVAGARDLANPDRLSGVEAEQRNTASFAASGPGGFGAAGVAFASVSSSVRSAVPDALGRAELTVTMRGKYPDIKTVLSDIQNRFPHLVLPRLSLRRVSSPNDIEARVDLLLLARPLHAPSAAAS